MNIHNVHLAFVEFFDNRYSIPEIETLWNHVAIPILSRPEKPPKLPLFRTQSVVAVVEPTKAVKSVKGIAKVKREIENTETRPSRIQHSAKRENKPPPFTDDSPSVCAILNRGD